MSTHSAQLSLLPETPDDRAQRIDAEILSLIMGKPGGAFGETLGPKEKAVLSAIRFHRGHRNAISGDEIQRAAKINGRTVKGIVRRLIISFLVPIGSSKLSDQGGYFLCITREDIDISCRDVWQQVKAEFARLRVLGSEKDALDMIQQLKSEVTA